MKKTMVAGAVLFILAAFISSSALAAEKIVLSKFANLKVGFTTQNFLQPLPVSLANAKKLIDWASDQGFAWIELRDPSAKLTLNECKQIAAYAKEKKLDVAYAVQIGLLDPAFWEIFSRGVANAPIFDGPRTIRSLASGGEFAADPKKKGWNLSELYRAVMTANRAANMAKSFGVQHVAENATEALKGDGVSFFGTTEFFANVNSNVGWQMDTANFFAVSRVVTKPQEAWEFLQNHVGNLFYTHIKSSSKEHKTTDVLQENELGFDLIFPLLSMNKIYYVAIELNQKPELKDCQDNLMKSVEFLKKNY